MSQEQGESMNGLLCCVNKQLHRSRQILSTPEINDKENCGLLLKMKRSFIIAAF